MPPKTRHKSPAHLHAIPQTRDEANAAVRAIGAASRDLARIEAAMNDELAKIKERFEKEADPLRAEIKTLTQAAQIWCEANRADLTQGGRVKSADLPAGQVGWRLRPPSCGVRGADSVIETLKRLGLGRFVRVKEEVNKEAILNEPEAVAGVSGITIGQGEDFFVVPFEAELSGEAA